MSRRTIPAAAEQDHCAPHRLAIPFAGHLAACPDELLPAVHRGTVCRSHRHRARHFYGRHRHRVYRALATTVEVLRPIPAIALIPFAIFYLGIGDASKIFLIAYGAIFPILLNTIAGMRDSDRVLVNAGLVLGATNAQIIVRIRVPTALPYILAGFRISVGLGLVVLVASEMVGATSGIGFYILNSEMTWKIEDMFTGIMLLSLIGVTANWSLLRLEARVLKWR
jgi:NitT/TauT family transport system permease protein